MSAADRDLYVSPLGSVFVWAPDSEEARKHMKRHFEHVPFEVRKFGLTRHRTHKTLYRWVGRRTRERD